MKTIEKGERNTGRTKEIQIWLQSLGLYKGIIDDDFGPITEQAVRDFQEQYLVHGKVDALTYQALQAEQKTGASISEENLAPLTLTEKQEILKAKGYYLGAIDGDFGPISQKAEADFRLAEALGEADNLDEALRREDYAGVISAFLNSSQYHRSVMTKRQIVIHHTASNGDAWAVQRYWNQNPNRVATDFIIGSDGKILRVIPKGYWAWHLGVPTPNRILLNGQSIGIELANYGYLTEREGQFINAYNMPIPESRVYRLPMAWKNLRYFEDYTPAQLRSLERLLHLLLKTYDIPLNREEFKLGSGGVFELSQEALNGKPGIYTHNSFLRGKTDAYPHHDLIEILQKLP